MMSLSTLQLSWLQGAYPADEVTLASALPYDTAFKLYSDVLSYGPNFHEVLSVADKMKSLHYLQSTNPQDSEDAYLGLRRLLPANHNEILTKQGTTNAPEVISSDLSIVIRSVHVLAKEVQDVLETFSRPDFWELAVILHGIAGHGIYDWNPYSNSSLWEGYEWAGSHYMPQSFTSTSVALAKFNMKSFLFYKNIFAGAQ